MLLSHLGSCLCSQPLWGGGCGYVHKPLKVTSGVLSPPPRQQLTFSSVIYTSYPWIDTAHEPFQVSTALTTTRDTRPYTLPSPVEGLLDMRQYNTVVRQEQRIGRVNTRQARPRPVAPELFPSVPAEGSGSISGPAWCFHQWVKRSIKIPAL